MIDAEEVATQLARIPTVASFTAIFVEMDGRNAVVNVGDNSLVLPCDGFYPPVPGMPVRVQSVKGKYWVTGPARSQNPVGTVMTTSPGPPPTVTVKVGEDEYSLGYRADYTPESGHLVEINWVTGIVQGEITAEQKKEGPGKNPKPGRKKFSNLLVYAVGSGRFQSGGSWGNDPWGSSSNRGIWVYGNRIKNALKGAKVTEAEIFLPLISHVGNATWGLHGYSSLPGFTPSITSLTPMSHLSGWQRIPDSWIPFIQDGYGIGVGQVSGFNKWHGTASDPLSGAMRFSGTR